MSGEDKYQAVIESNIQLHSQLAEHYNTCEPHFRPENINKVKSIIERIANETGAQKALDLGCGTGFLINILKNSVPEIHGVDVTPAMLAKVDTSGDAKIELFEHDTGTFDAEPGNYQMVTAYSFLHHLYDVAPTLETAYKALAPGGKFYADLEPNFYFWEQVDKLDREGEYDPIVKREIEMVTYKDEDIQKNFGIDKDTFNQAEYGKNIMGGFREEELIEKLKEAGFSKVELFYHWYIGQGYLINAEEYDKEDRFAHADVMDAILQKALPLSRHLFKYMGFIATK